MGHWDAAEYESREAFQLAKRSNDTLQVATALTNLACTAIERGAWDEAKGYTREATRLHEALSTALDVAIPLQLNAANLAFYQGRVQDALSLYSNVYERAETSGLAEFKIELEACLGLTALQLRDVNSARYWTQQCNTDETALDGMQERFKVEWLWAYTHRRSDPDAVRDRLRRVAKSQENVDRIGSLKLKWLEQILFSAGRDQKQRASQVDTREELKGAGLVWFVHFSERWCRLANGTGI
jgi:tetratricopeptide (TPR) repeat protein